MRHVLQRELLGCGPACLAMVAEITYEQARDLLTNDRDRFKKKNWNKHTGARPEEMINALQKLKIKSFVTKDFKYLLCGSKCNAVIVSFEWPTHPDQRHYVVWDPKQRKFLDPATPKWYKFRHASTYLTGLKNGSGIIVVR